MAGVALLGSPRSFMSKSSNFSGSGRKTVVTPLRLVTYNARLPSRKTVETVGTNWNLTPGQKPSVNEILHVSFRYPRPEGGSTAFSFSHSPSHPDDHHGQKAPHMITVNRTGR